MQSLTAYQLSTIYIERVDLNSIADETSYYVVVVENTDSISKPYYSSSYVQDYFPRLTRRHDDETRSEAFDDFGGERERGVIYQNP